LAGVEYPHVGAPAIVRAGGSFATRFSLRDVSLKAAMLCRQVGPARISRPLRFEEDKDRAYDSYVEGKIVLPDDVPPGLYDLVYQVSPGGRREDQRSPRSVFVVSEFPQDPVFVTFGHADTWGQEQAEYLQRLAAVANLIAPDMVLDSNELNAAYACGALADLQMPHLMTFGNHQVAGHEEWYGDSVSMVDFGPDLCILNFSGPWHGDLSHAYALLESRAETRCKIINAFEHDAPVEDMLDRYGICFLHEAHGPKPKVMTMGRTPTQRAGKVNSESFRVVRFRKGRPVSFTYASDPEAPIPLKRHEAAPMQVSFFPANDGLHGTVTATVENRWKQAFPSGRVTFVLPAGEYLLDRGVLESAILSDDGRYVVLATRVDIPADGAIRLTVRPRNG
jgi:hypothetical protein